MGYEQYLEVPDDVIEGLKYEEKLQVYLLALRRIRALARGNPDLLEKIKETLLTDGDQIYDEKEDPSKFMGQWNALKDFQQKNGLILQDNQ